MHKLIISDDEGKTTVVPLARDEITIGRKEGNTIRLTERNVSRRHARLVRANGAFQIEDLGSFNGIRLNGVRIADKSSVKEGDQIQIGDYQLALQSDKAAAARAVSEEAVTVASGLPAQQPIDDGATEVMVVPIDEALAAAAAPATGVPHARLVLVSAPAPGQEFELSKDEMVIGRAEECEVSINHRSISREHAKILRVDQAYRVLDLESANGVRVNGQDVPYAELRRGDVVELGHVRLRFVAPGEVYRFDADATIQMSPGIAPDRSSRAPIWVLAAALILASGVGLYLAWRPPDTIATPPLPPRAAAALPAPAHAPPAVPTTPIPPPPPRPDHDVMALLEAARGYMREGKLNEALASVAQARSQEPANLEADQLFRELSNLRLGEQRYVDGHAKLPDKEAAFLEFERIPPGDQHYEDPEVIDVLQSVLRARLTRANEALRDARFDEAKGLVEGVRDHHRVGTGAPRGLLALRGEAELLLARIADRERAVAQTPPVRNAWQQQQQQQRQHQQTPAPEPTPEPAPNQEQATVQTPPTPPAPAPAPEGDAEGGSGPRSCGRITTASAARCFVDATNGNATGEYMLRNLILAHTLLGERARARTLATRYFNDYGTSPFAQQIRQLGYSP